jgi:alkylation response protein AidB-like acyl-CoA dehydrogenase
MAYELTDAHEELRRSVREFGEDVVRPAAERLDESTYPTEVINAAADRGYVGPLIPDEYGGGGYDTLGAAIIVEELWRADTNLGCAIGISGFPTNVELLVEYGDEWMREEWLPKVASAEVTDGIAVTEPGHGSDVAAMETTATRDSDEWVLDGEKTFIGNATDAAYLLVFARTSPAEGHGGISVFLVPTDVDGYDAQPITGKMGTRAAKLGHVYLDGARIPADHLVGEEDQGFYHFMHTLAKGRTIVAAQGVGAASAGLEAARSYATEREQFGRPIGDFQAVSHSIAEMATRTEAARSMTYRAATAADWGRDDAPRLASMAKLFASETGFDVLDDALQIHGGAGYTGEYPVERYLRDVRATRIYEGTSEIQKSVVADDLLPS